MLALLLACADPVEKPDPCATTGISDQHGVVHDTLYDASRGAGPGGTVFLCEGTYREPALDLVDGVSLRGAGIDRTILDHGADDFGTGRTGLFVTGAGTVTLADLTLADAVSVPGAEDDAYGFGGGVVVLGGDLRLERVRLAGNIAHYGGAIAVLGDAAAGAAVTLRDTELVSNVAHHHGGAVGLFAPSTLVVEDTRFDGNTPDDIALFDRVPAYEAPRVEPVATYTFMGVASFTCDWAAGTCG